MQEAFLRAWRASASYDPARSSQRTWLFAILRNVVIDLARGPPGASPARQRRPRTGSRAATTSIDRVLTTWQVEAALAAAGRRPSAGARRGALARAALRRGRRRPRHPGRHREEPRVLRPARHARRARGAGVARWLSIQPACAEWREHLAAWLVAQVGPDDEAALVEHLVRLRQRAGGGDSLLVVAAISLGADPGGEPWRPATDAAPRRPRRSHRRPCRHGAPGPPLSPGGAGADGDGRRGGGARRRRDAR